MADMLLFSDFIVQILDGTDAISVIINSDYKLTGAGCSGIAGGTTTISKKWK